MTEQPETKKSTNWWKGLLIIVPALFVVFVVVPEFAKKEAHTEVVKELEEDNNPTGMLGGSWHMNQSEIKNKFPDIREVDKDTLLRQTEYYGRPALVSYNFQEGSLLQIVAVFQTGDQISLSDAEGNYASTRTKLVAEYGEMTEPNLNDVGDGDHGALGQDILESSKQMGRSKLVHKLFSQDGRIMEQVYMFLTKG